MKPKNETHTNPASTGLVGRCFVVFREEKKIAWQGFVVAKLDDKNFLVQLFHAFDGSPNVMLVVSIDDLSLKGASPSNARAPGAWEFFENDDHLRHWMQNIYTENRP